MTLEHDADFGCRRVIVYDLYGAGNDGCTEKLELTPASRQNLKCC